MDYNNRLICINNLSNSRILSPSVNFYKRELEAYVIEIKENSYFFEKDISYYLINNLIDGIQNYAQKNNFSVYITPELSKFLFNKDIKIEKRRSLGLAIKEKNSILASDFHNFSSILSQEMIRKLREPQL